jgi:hypothetical protein
MERMERMPGKIISGGQTGADRAALDGAMEAGVQTGGWVPRGRLAEDGVIPDTYPNLTETDTEAPGERTRRNVLHADGTVVIVHGPVRGGTAYTVSCARELKKPLLIIDLSLQTIPEGASTLRKWVAGHRIAVLNVAGPRAGEDSLIYQDTRQLMAETLRPAR